LREGLEKGSETERTRKSEEIKIGLTGKKTREGRKNKRIFGCCEWMGCERLFNQLKLPLCS
jgi:hypothetical protein